MSGFLGVSLPQSIFSWSVSAEVRRFRAGRALGWLALSERALRSGLLGDVRRDERVALRLMENRGLGTGSVAHAVLHEERNADGEAGV